MKKPFKKTLDIVFQAKEDAVFMKYLVFFEEENLLTPRGKRILQYARRMIESERKVPEERRD